MTPIVQEARNAWCEAPVSSCGLLVDGDDYYRAFYEAGQRAERYLALAGWQFDSDACLLRGTEAKRAQLPVTLLAYLDALCARRPELRIYMLAWDFHPVFALEREWIQDLVFQWKTSDRLQFRFDAAHADRGSHHQKFVIVDGQLCFLGGLDLCDHRWDDRKHAMPNPLRISRGAPHKPFHDVQAYLTGDAVGRLVQLFESRWAKAGGEPLDLGAVAVPARTHPPPTGAVPLAAQRVAFSRTDPYGAPDGTPDCHEIGKLHVDAITAAERLIYAETQYFSSRHIGAALCQRLRAGGAPLDVVLVLNMEAETLKEELAIGLAQAKVIGELRQAAHGTQHRLGIYYTLPSSEDGGEPDRATYIHSKLMIVDDRFLTMGSANLTNRSVGLDTELNLSVETDQPQGPLGQSIRGARYDLIHEHLGLDRFDESASLVAALDQLAHARSGRLRLHPSPTERERSLLEVLDPQALPFDPDAFEDPHEDHKIFVGGVGALWRKLFGGHEPSSG